MRSGRKSVKNDIRLKAALRSDDKQLGALASFQRKRVCSIVVARRPGISNVISQVADKAASGQCPVGSRFCALHRGEPIAEIIVSMLVKETQLKIFCNH